MILLLLSVFLGIIPSFAVSDSSKPNISCLIINLEYVNCTWSQVELKHNYSFRSRFSHCEMLDCPSYHRINGVNVGCKVPYTNGQRFNTLETWLYSDDRLVTEQSNDLKYQVKLNPPFNLTVEEKKDAELWLYWNVTKSNCGESVVRHRTDNNEWKISSPAARTSFSLPFPSRKRYEFQVKARISSSCGESKFWSDWSESVFWGSSKANNGTESLGPVSMTSLVMYTLGGLILLLILSCLLVHCERLRIILIPVVPNPGRNVNQYLTSLFENYDGNIEKWLSMPKDLENGFKPNFTERACPVREYRMMSESSSDSESILSNPTDLSSDYQCMHSYSSASTITGPAEDLPTQGPAPDDNPV